MDATLSSLIAFVGFLIIFSMLIQSVQEALKNLFKLKAGVWERFFINLYSTDFRKKSTLAEKPFWKRVRSGQFVGEFEQRLMRLKTIVIRADDLIKEVKLILVELIAMDPDKPDDRTALKIEHLYEKICQIKGLKIETILKLYDKQNMLSVSRKKNLKAGKMGSTEVKKGPIAQFAKDFDAIFSEFDKRLTQTPKATKEMCEKLQTIILEFEKKLSTYRIQIENKADAWLVQLQGEYKKNMLKWTLYISIAAVVILNADAFSVYKYFSVNSKAQEIMIETVSSSILKANAVRSEDLNDIHDALKNNDFNKGKIRIQEVAGQFAKEFGKMKNEENKKKATAVFDSVESIKEVSKDDLQTLKEHLGELSGLYLALQKISIDYHMASMEAAGLPLGWSADLKLLTNNEDELIFPRVVKKFFGLVLTIFLVSFGAPFWKNIMNALIGIKNLSKKPDTELPAS